MYTFFAELLPPFVATNIFPFVAFFISLFFLVKSADYFVDFAERFGLKIGVPEFVIGVLVIGLGTSLPELATSIASIYGGSEEELTSLITANILGSNIANILLGVGIASILKTVVIDRNLVDNDIPFLFSSTAVAIFFLSDGLLSRGEGILLLAMFIVFILFSVFDKSQPINIDAELKKAADKDSLPLLIFLLFLSGAGIVFSASVTIDSLVNAAPILGVDKDVASSIFLAVGTSFPEIFVTIVAIKKGKTGLAIGNILGSNIGNILGILGISAVLHPLVVSPLSLSVSVPFLGIATLFFIFATIDNRIRIWEGLMTIAILLSYYASIFGVI